MRHAVSRDNVSLETKICSMFKDPIISQSDQNVSTSRILILI